MVGAMFPQSAQTTPDPTGWTSGIGSAYDTVTSAMQMAMFQYANYAESNFATTGSFTGPSGATGGIPNPLDYINGGTGTGSTDNPEIFWGTKHDRAFDTDHYVPADGDQKHAGHLSDPDITSQHILHKNGAMRLWDQMTMEEQRNKMRLILLAGYPPPGSSFPVDPSDVDDLVSTASMSQARDLYSSFLDDAAARTKRQQFWTPDQLLRKSIQWRLQGTGYKWNGDLDAFNHGVPNKLEQAIESGTSSEGIKPGSYTTTSTTTSIYDPQDVKSMVRDTITNALGRDPTQAEYEDFVGALNAAQHEDPTTSTTTATYKNVPGAGVQQTDSNTTTQQGIQQQGLSQLAYEKAQRQPGYAEWQAMGTYAPALFQALGSAVPGV